MTLHELSHVSQLLASDALAKSTTALASLCLDCGEEFDSPIYYAPSARFANCYGFGLLNPRRCPQCGDDYVEITIPAHLVHAYARLPR